MLTQNNSPLSDEENVLIRESILLPSLLTFTERSLRDLYAAKRMSGGTLGELYVACTKAIISRIKADIRKINVTLTAQSIRVDRDRITETSVSYRIICRGQVNDIEIAKEAARNEIGVQLSAYIKRVVTELDGSKNATP